MRKLTFGATLKAALLAGIAAGLLVAGFHFVATEPLIDRAIEIEEQLSHAAGHAEEAPIVTRDVQRAGLFLGFLIYGITWSLFLAAAYFLLQSWLPAETARGRGLLLVGVGYWSVALMPFLKYPANPPGVGDPETITFRQTAYLAFLALSLLGAGIALAIARTPRRRLYAVAFGLVYSVVLFALMPANPDLVEMPMDLVNTFRAMSLLGLTLFWALMGSFFWLLLPRETAAVQARAYPART